MLTFLNECDDYVEIRGFVLKLYDKVIHLKNLDMNVLDKSVTDYSNINLSNANTERVYNGSLGQVVHIDKDEEYFIVDYVDYKAIYDFDHFKDIIDLGYALTVHKTQGSQFKYVFLPILNIFYIMLNSKLLYTAMTRAKEKLYFISQDFALKKSCETKLELNRRTMLSNLEVLKSLFVGNLNLSWLKHEISD